MLGRFQYNNFGVLDEMLHCVGAAVYPLGAMLNHSCSPNCVLRYKLGNPMGPILQVINTTLNLHVLFTISHIHIYFFYKMCI